MKIFTIGHSNHPFEYFLELLTKHSINCVVDVRSIAASRFNPQFNKKNLIAKFAEAGIEYLHFDKEFGARRIDKSSLNDQGQVDFVKVQSSMEFNEGVLRLEAGVKKGYTIVLMCAEADPLTCHRFGMVTRFLSKSRFEVFHILKDGSLLKQEMLEEELINKNAKKMKAVTGHREQILQKAYELLNRKIGFKP